MVHVTTCEPGSKVRLNGGVCDGVNVNNRYGGATGPMPHTALCWSLSLATKIILFFLLEYLYMIRYFSAKYRLIF